MADSGQQAAAGHARFVRARTCDGHEVAVNLELVGMSKRGSFRRRGAGDQIENVPTLTVYFAVPKVKAGESTLWVDVFHGDEADWVWAAILSHAAPAEARQAWQAARVLAQGEAMEFLDRMA